jgi:hypothetical protein
MMKNCLLLASFCFYLFSCAPEYRLSYLLLDVKHLETSAHGSDSIRIITDSVATARAYRFSDSLVDVTLWFTREQVGFSCKNIATHPLRIDWEKCAFINSAGIRMRVIHQGVIYSSKDVYQLATTLHAGECVSDYLIPARHVHVYNCAYNELCFSIYPLLSKADIGMMITVVLVFSVNDSPVEYQVRCQVQSAE